MRRVKPKPEVAASAPNAGGRPSVYDPKFCKRVVDFMALGFSLTAFAGEIGVSRETIYAWTETHADFKQAMGKARAARTLYWETRLKKAEKDTRAVIFALGNACGEEWRMKPDVAVTVNNSVEVDGTKPPEEWGVAELEAELKRRGAMPTAQPVKITQKKPRHD
jgi:hypothetical protein